MSLVSWHNAEPSLVYEHENGRCSLFVWTGMYDLYSSFVMYSPQILNLEFWVQKCRASRESILEKMVSVVASKSNIPEQTFCSFITSSILALVSRTNGRNDINSGFIGGIFKIFMVLCAIILAVILINT